MALKPDTRIQQSKSRENQLVDSIVTSKAPVNKQDKVNIRKLDNGFNPRSFSFI
jgi:hypothetical protein